MPPNKASFEPFAAGSSSLPLLVRMPDGERRQVDVSANASVRDLKDSIAANMASWSSSALPTTTPAAPASPTPPGSLAGWDLDFAGSVLNDSATLGDYNIPDVYDHASGLLRTISDSAHADAGKKVEALDKACAVVQGISRGERDMERLISAVFDDDNPVVGDDAAQPSLTSMRRRGRSKIPALNLSNLPPPGPPSAKASPRAPPTPSQLIRRLSSSRPDLYNPAAARRAGDPAAPPAPGASGEIKRQASWFTEAAAMGGPDPSSGANATVAHENAQGNQGSGALKRGTTWFTDVISAIGNSVEQPKREYGGEGSSEGEGDANDDVGGSEDEHLAPKREAEGATVGAATTGKTEPVSTDAKQGIQKTGDKKGTKLPAVADNKAGETLNAAVSAAAAVAGANVASAKPTSGTASANTGDSTSKSANAAAPVTGTVAPKENAAGGTHANKAGVPAANNTSQPSGAPRVEPQVIGLNPEHTHPEEDVKMPKKRGRKRKNPHLTEEQRKLQRQAQNRESAKLSRIRRKNMTAEYEKRVNTLEGENENLRDTVAALTDRLEILQNLLTISVQKRPVATGPLAQSILPPQTTGQTLLAHGPASIAPQTSIPQPPQLANMNYKTF